MQEGCGGVGGRIDKLKARILSRPRDFTLQEADQLFTHFGYVRYNQGKTSGSRIAYYNPQTKAIFRTHAPHPGDELKLYAVDDMIKHLREKGLL